MTSYNLFTETNNIGRTDMNNLFEVFFSGNFVGEVWAPNEYVAIGHFGGEVGNPDWTTKALTAF